MRNWREHALDRMRSGRTKVRKILRRAVRRSDGQAGRRSCGAHDHTDRSEEKPRADTEHEHLGRFHRQRWPDLPDRRLTIRRPTVPNVRPPARLNQPAPPVLTYIQLSNYTIPGSLVRNARMKPVVSAAQQAR